MFISFLKLAFRNLLRHKIFSLITIIGLAIGMAAAIVILRYIFYESSYEDFNKNGNNVYRITVSRYQNDVLQFKSARSYPGLAQLVHGEIPEVELSSRAYPEECLFKYEDIKISGQTVLWVDDPFIKMFDVNLIKQLTSEPLKNTYTTVISVNAAHRFFGTENPLGKTIILNEGVPFIINGVFQNYPENSHFKFDFLLSMNTIGAIEGDEILTSVFYNWLYTYVQIKAGSSTNLIEQKFQTLVNEHFTYLNDTNSKVDMHLQTLQDIHLKSDLSEEISVNSNMQTIYFLLLIALIIMITAWINFINLSTARALDRAKEVGLRKVVGAVRSQIVTQFIFESALVNIMSFCISIGLVEISRSFISQLINRNIGVSIFDSPLFWCSVFIMFLIFGILAGIYPAFILSSFNPSQIIKGKFRNTGKGITIRKSLVVFQYTAAIALIISTLVITNQIEYLRKQNKGFNPEQVLCINSPRSFINNPKRVQYFERFKDSLSNIPAVEFVSASDVIPGKEIVSHIENFTRLGTEPKNVSISAVNIDRDFFHLLNIKCLAGKFFSLEFQSSDSSSVILNNTAAEILGFHSPSEAVNNYLVDFTNGHQFKVIGVIENYHQESFKKAVEPIIYFQGHGYQFGYFPVKLNTRDLSETIKEIGNIWSQVYPEDPFDFVFLDDFFNEQYKADIQFGKTVLTFSILAIIIASLGLFGLSTLVAVQRTKEIGIRKTLGASVKSLIFLLSLDFLKLIVWANLIAWPIVYFALDHWLNTFTERISLSILYFIIPGMLIIIIAFITMGFQILKTSLENPIASLKYE